MGPAFLPWCESVPSMTPLQLTLMAIPTDRNGYATLGGRPKSDRRPIIAEAIYNASGGRCVICGEEADPRTTHGARSFQLGHLVPAGPKHLGWVPGNIASQCGACNGAAGNTNLVPYIPMFALPDGILTEWPLGRRGGQYIDERALREAARRKLGLPF